MLSNKAKYGLKAVLLLAREPFGKPVLVAEIASQERIPLKFLGLILLELKRHGIVQSKKGKRGGYFLRRPPDQISVGNVVRVLDGPLALVPCVSQTAYATCEDCVDEQRCGVRMAMKEVRDATAQILDRLTLDQVNRSTGSLSSSRRPQRNE